MKAYIYTVIILERLIGIVKMNIRVEKTKNPKQKPQDENQLGFGKYFTDHMLLMEK